MSGSGRLRTADGPHPTRLLMTTDCVGGVWDYALTLLDGLRAFIPAAIEPTLVAIGPAPSTHQFAAVTSRPWVRFEHLPYRLEWMPGAFGRSTDADANRSDVDRVAERLTSIARDAGVTLVHLNGFAHAATDFGVPVVVVAHSDVTAWFRAVVGIDPPPEYDAYRAATAAGLSAADAVITPTAAVAGALRRDYGFVTPPPRVIPNARDASAYRVAVKRPTVLAAGRVWDEAKGIRTLIEAADGLEPESWQVRIAGDGMGQAPETFPPNVVPLGWLSPDTLAGEMASASIYCLPARYEPFGLSVLEAALSGCALVLGDVPSLRDVWGDAAVYVGPGDAGALRRTLNGLIVDRVARETLADAARTRATRYGVDAQARAYVDVYRRLLTPRGGTEGRRCGS